MQVMGNLMPETRLATATCLEQSTLLRVNGDQYHQVLKNPEAVLAVAKKVRERPGPRVHSGL